jgi:hypothetical protein
MAKVAKNGNVSGKGRIGGRAKGTPNKMTKSVKEAIEFAADGLGGAQRLVDWAKEDPKNEGAFWTNIYPKLLPLQVTGEGGGAIQHKVTHGMDKDASELIALIRGQ